MQCPFAYALTRPLYVYSEDGTHTHSDKLRGLLKYSPLRAATTTEPRCLFVFRDEDRDHANRLYLALRNGIAKFPGCKQLAGVSIEKSLVEPLRVVAGSGEDLGRAFYNAVLKRLGQGDLPDFAFIIYSKEPDPSAGDPYPGAKAALATYGVPSQYVSWQTLDSPQLFRYAVSNVALNVFVKLGGVPWSVFLETETPSLVVGIGRVCTGTGAERRRLTGFATCTLSNGIYLNTSFFPPVDNEIAFLESLRNGLSGALSAVLQQSTEVRKVTVHVSQKERRDVILTIRDTVGAYERQAQIPIPYEIVRLTEDSDFRVLDLNDSGWVSEEGTVVALARGHGLLVTEGRREKDVWRGRRPVTLELRREFASVKGLEFRETIRDAFTLSSVNWRGFNAVTQPMTLQYARLLTQLVEKMARIDPDIGAKLVEQTALNSVPWFI